ncbi:MAG: pyruvate kinase [Chloroflexi bacterium]|nr:pyruvate kinase [Chloroflexota bacterium]
MTLPARRTKIVATLGPATPDQGSVEALVRAGVDVFRLNFSHGTQEVHGERIRQARAAAERVGRDVGILMDAQGPKIRIGALAGGGPVELADGARIIITTEPVAGTAERISTTYSALPDDVKPGDPILLDDGRLRLRVTGVESREVLAVVEHGGLLAEHKGINLPGVAISSPALTEKDRSDIAFGVREGVDFVGLSFVRSAQDVRDARALLDSLGSRAPIISKIEKPEALQVLDEILEVSDGVMVARGDLGVELPPELVPAHQKRIIHRANRQGIPSITATQMLESMIGSPRPTRAEVSDVFNAIWDGTEAIMLSGETAVGKYPVDAVEMMDRIAREAERRAPRVESRPERLTNAHAVTRAACALAEAASVQMIVCWTRTGRTAELLSEDRPRVPVVAFTPLRAVQHRLALRWGVTAFVCEMAATTEELFQTVERAVIGQGLAPPGRSVVVVGAIPLRSGVHTNFVKLHTLSVAHPARSWDVSAH